jgi:AraC-like DNA-binding protein
MLIHNPDLQIVDISDLLGFGSSRYFTRCFKAKFEISPTEYRKKGKDEKDGNKGEKKG